MGNEAEYKALIAGLDFAKVAGAKNMVVYCDSQVVTSQVNGSYECKNKRIKKYLEQVKDRVNNFQVLFKYQGRRMSTSTILLKLPQQSTCSSLVRYYPLFKSHN